MKTAKNALLAATLALLAACNFGPPLTPRAEAGRKFGKAYAAALEAEQRDSTSAEPYLDAIDLAIRDPEEPAALALVLASLDALGTGGPMGFEVVGSTAIAFRSSDVMQGVVQRLDRAYRQADPAARPSSSLPFIRSSLATTLHEFALFAGDAKAAETWGQRRGCANTATIIGPLDWAALRSLEGPSPIDAKKPLAESYAGIPPFGGKVTPHIVSADQCRLHVNATSFLAGLRAVVVDYDSPRAQKVHFTLVTSSAAVLDVGGKRVLSRGYDAGGRPVARLASVEVPQGRIRAVVRVAQKGDGNHIELAAVGDDGNPLAVHAPRKGDPATGGVGRVKAVDIVPATGDADEVLLSAGGLLALGDARAAEHLLEVGLAENAKRLPALDLLYVMALDGADDVPENKVVERMRQSVERLSASWPWSWQAKVFRAQATERRKGAGEGLVEAMRELTTPPPEGGKVPKPERMLLAYTSLVAKKLDLRDRMEEAYRDVARIAPESALVAQLDARLHARVGRDLVRAACQAGGSRADLDCFDAKKQAGDFPGALRELDRLRRLRNARDGLRDAELGVRLAMGDLKGALSLHDRAGPAERRILDALGLAAGRGDVEAVRKRLRRDEVSARDAPYSIGPISRALGLEADPSKALEEEGAKLVAADKGSAFLPGAATAVLRHVERYTIEASGLLRYSTYDLRRVSGTTDVANSAVSHGPVFEGRAAPRLLRRRIHKRDGRILEPDAATNAQQQSDLSQLETGDYVEQIAQGFLLPGDGGQLVVDTPDLLPERTSVREAQIEIRRAASIPFSLWSHPLLGKAEEVRAGSYITSTWKLKNRPPRRIEDGVPRTERSVGVSIGTQTWANVARAMAENARALDEKDPMVRKFALEAAGQGSPSKRVLLERVVAAVGKTVKLAAPAELSDVAALLGTGSQRSNARTTIELGQGSRTWVLYRVLRELGVKADVAVSEMEPFSSSADYPPHAGRFRHPLLIARLGAEGGDVWIDSDVEGPPLPPGRISPELRGRTAMLLDGTTVTVEGSVGEVGDEIDLRLVLDEKGDAKGTFTVLMHGRAAQGIAESFETVVGTERAELLRTVILAWVPWADVDEVTVSSTEGSWEVALRASVVIRGYGRPEGSDGKNWTLAGLDPVHVVFPKRHAGLLAATYATRGARQNALSIDVPIQYHFRRRLELPAGAKITRPPPSMTTSDARLVASRKVKIEGAVLEEDFTLSVPTGTVPADQYGAFVEKVHAVDDGFMAGTRVRVKP